jgi:A/G-specific adenine glycosylase
MLQQTQVATVIPYYERFISAFPDVRRLADAAEDEVLHHWSGLGYYARARNLHRTAKTIVADYDGAFPADLDALQSLPGIGRSTAGAILSSALGGRAPILDGNVKRVLARFHAVEGWPGKSDVAAKLWDLAELHTPAERVADYTQAIMDLGATLCSRAKPDCTRCPQHQGCEALRLGRQADFPGKKPKKSLPTRSTIFAIACTPERELLLERRPGSGIWGGLWCFPEFADAEQARHYCENQLAAEILEISPMALLRHSFSHYHLEISPLLITLSQATRVIRESDDLRYWAAEALPEVGLAAPVKRLWQQVAAILSTESTQRTGAQT